MSALRLRHRTPYIFPNTHPLPIVTAPVPRWESRVSYRLNDRDVPRILKEMAKAAGLALNPSGHSARVGVAQDMAAAGFGLAEIMQAGRWKSPAMPARYSENQQARRGAAAKLAALQDRT